jgi:ribosome biogenesis GTPase
LTEDRLARLGWDAGWQAELKALDDPQLRPARVSAEHRGAYVLFTEEGEQWATPTGRLRLAAKEEGADMPAVGDWVGYKLPEGTGRAVVQAVLPRRTKFSRKAAMDETREQVMGANIDVAFLTTALPDDLNLRRLERYLATAWDSGAQPVIVLTKADLSEDVDAAVAEVEKIAFGVPVHAVSVPTGRGIEELRAQLEPNRTAVLLGSSGVGKSTIVNALLGDERVETQEIRDDGRGRHTTTHRELHLLPGHGILLDTPGIRELQLWGVDEGLDEAFEDIDELAGECKFADCSHEHEPGCAVCAAVEAGTLPAERLESYRKLQRELAALAARQSALLRTERRGRPSPQSRTMRPK